MKRKQKRSITSLRLPLVRLVGEAGQTTYTERSISMKVEPDEAQRVLQWFLDNMGKFDMIDRGTLLNAIRADRLVNLRC